MPSPLLPAIEAYDAFAPSYNAYAEPRTPYLRAIDEIVISRAHGAKSFLDVGAGDGRRSMELARLLGAERIVLLEPSQGMRSRCPEGIEVWPYLIEEVPDGVPPFELITCLWNVLGHISGTEQRVRALSRLRRLLAPQGRIFLDVNHRYNAAEYGWTKTAARLLHDTVIRSDKNGDVTVSWQSGERLIRTPSHVFTHREMERLFRSSGLRQVRRWVIHYDTGAVGRVPFTGQLFYELTACD